MKETENLYFQKRGFLEEALGSAHMVKFNRTEQVIEILKPGGNISREDIDTVERFIPEGFDVFFVSTDGHVIIVIKEASKCR